MRYSSASTYSTSARPTDRNHVSGTDRFAGSRRASNTSPAARGAQRLQALRRANEVRLARAATKRKIAAGTMSVIEAIGSDSSEISRMAVSELLLSQRSWGTARCRGLLMAVPLSETKTVGSMTARQRSLLAALLTNEMQPRSLHGPD
jgi:hypothetical protein